MPLSCTRLAPIIIEAGMKRLLEVNAPYGAGLVIVGQNVPITLKDVDQAGPATSRRISRSSQRAQCRASEAEAVPGRRTRVVARTERCFLVHLRKRCLPAYRFTVAFLFSMPSAARHQMMAMFATFRATPNRKAGA